MQNIGYFAPWSRQNSWADRIAINNVRKANTPQVPVRVRVCVRVRVRQCVHVRACAGVHMYTCMYVCVCRLVSYPRSGFDVHYAICFKKCAAGICIGAMSCP